jgi:site-specific recombinase XerD
MTHFSELLPVPSSHISDPDQLPRAAAAYLARFTGTSRDHTESDLRCYLTWCSDRGLDPLAAQRAQLELYIRWMQEVRRFQPSTVSRRFSVVAGFYRTCVIDGVVEHSPAEHVRRPTVPPESPTLGFTHLQFEALLTAARESANPNDFALVAMLGLPGLRIFEATGCYASAAKAPKSSWSRCHQQSDGPSTAPSAPGPAGRSRSAAAAPGWTGTPPPDG